jgi:hypothetical protein
MASIFEMLLLKLVQEQEQPYQGFDANAFHLNTQNPRDLMMAQDAAALALQEKTRLPPPPPAPAMPNPGFLQ